MIRKKRFTVKVSTVKNFFMSLLFVLYLPTFVTRIVDIPYWRLICYIIICIADVYYIFLVRKRAVITVSTFFLYFLLVTVIRNPEDILLCAARTFSGMSFILMLEFIYVRYSKDQVLNIFMSAMEVFLYINLISMIVFPAGMYRVVTNGIYEELVPVARNAVRTNARVIWLLGHQTMLIRFTLPAICIALLYWYNKTKWKRVNVRSLVLITVCVIETIIANSAGNYIILALFAAFCVYFHFRGKISNVMIYVGIIAIYIVAVNLEESTWLLSFLSSKLDRTVTVSTRVSIWINTISAWLEKPLFGYGYINESSSAIRQLLSLGNPHSSYLWALFEGGVVGFALLIYMIYFFGRNMKDYWKSPSAQIIYSAFICLLICMIDDDHVFRSPFFLIIFSLTYHIPQMAGNEEMGMHIPLHRESNSA